MPKKCEHCGSLLDEQQPVCGICKVDSAADKNLAALVKKEEKKVNYYRRALYIVALLTIAGGCGGIIHDLPQFFETPWNFNIPFQVFGMIVNVFYLVYGVSLMNQMRFCYIPGIILYGVSIVLGLLSLNIVVVIANILFLS